MTSSVDEQTPIDHAFNYGYLAADHAVEVSDLAGWRAEAFGNLTVRLHPKTTWAVHEGNQVRAAVIGEPIDLTDDIVDPEIVVSTIGHLLEAEGLQQALRRVAYLGGRWTAMLYDGTETVLITDFAATQAVFWHHDERGTTFSNYSHLLAEATGAELNTPYRELMASPRDHGAKGTIYWPGVETPFIGVLPVLPNHALHLKAGSTPQHRRYYPFPETTAIRDSEKAYEAFRDLFIRHVRLICASTDQIGISLTGGTDSRSTLAATAPYLNTDTAVTWTYIDVSNPHAGMAADLEAAVKLAELYGLRHQVIDLSPNVLKALSTTAGTDYGRSYERSLRYSRQFRRVSVAYAEQLPVDTVQLQSMVAEVGTGFYKKRSGQPDVERLSYLYNSSPFHEHPLVRSAFERYVDYAGLDTEYPGPFDWHDLFYVEGRLGRWATLRIQEVDLAHRVQLPFNARGIVEALAGPLLEDRVDKQALKRFVAEHEPAGMEPSAAPEGTTAAAVPATAAQAASVQAAPTQVRPKPSLVRRAVRKISRLVGSSRSAR
ncbi:hypothetical protein AB0333_11620 [Citricoccus sp. NPDC079358]|uniref:hypothetical protein n=1 Tax=Citricoccus sp. NPDC079358 TaxID=3154653 RepID=UPI00344C23D5